MEIKYFTKTGYLAETFGGIKFRQYSKGYYAIINTGQICVIKICQSQYIADILTLFQGEGHTDRFQTYQW